MERFKGEKKTYCNAQMAPKMIRKYCGITPEGEKLLENAVTRLGLSARAHDRILKVARTIADLEAAADIQAKASERGDSVPDIGPQLLGLEVWTQGTSKEKRVLGSIDLGLPAVLPVVTPFLHLGPQR